MKNFVLAKDKESGRIVHINDIPEGYTGGRCSECNHPLIAANRNRTTRKKACYFRHDTNSTCTGNQLVHDLAVQVLVERKSVTLPTFRQVIRFPEEGETFECDEFVYESYVFTAESAVAEKGLRVVEKDRRPDITFCGDNILYVEVHHTNPVLEDRKESYRALDEHCVEVDVKGYEEYLEAGINQFAEFICHKSERRWIHLSSKTPELVIETQWLEDKYRTRLEREAESEAQRLVLWNQSRKKHSQIIEKLQALMDMGIEKLRFKLNQHDKYKLRKLDQKLEKRHGCIPDFINQEVDHDYAFKTARYRWQRLIHEKILEYHNYVLTGSRKWHEPVIHFTCQDFYSMLRERGVPVLELVSKTEEINGGVLTDTNLYKWIDRGMTEEEAKSVPRPLEAINGYLLFLGDSE